MADFGSGWRSCCNATCSRICSVRWDRRRLLQGEKLIEPENLLQRVATHEAGPVKESIREYVRFVCLVNPVFPTSREEELFATSYKYYCWYLDNLFESFAMELENWRRGFEGCLFIG